MTNRRSFLNTLLAGSASVLVAPRLLASNSTIDARQLSPVPHTAADDPWSELPAVLARIKAPVFPRRDFKIIDHGAVSRWMILPVYQIMMSPHRMFLLICQIFLSLYRMFIPMYRMILPI
jgi:hypothetical protein